MKRIPLALLAAAILLLPAARGSANEFTDVIDAFDDENDDPFDINLMVGYERQYQQALIRREDFTQTPHQWDYFAYQNMFEYTRITHVLNMELEFGIFKDLSIKGRVPLILSDTRELKRHKDMDGWSDANRDGSPDELFPLPFKSPDRSGVDIFAIGMWWGILDQGRDDTKPNWTVFAEGRFAVGDQLQAACSAAGDSDCRDLDYNNGDPFPTKGGISRGINELAVGTRLSRRFGILDPYFGFQAVVGWAKEGNAIKISGGSTGLINKNPPVVGTLDFGLELVPWEVPEHQRKFSIGIGAGGKYHSEGREYTPLFDALGVSPYFHDQPYIDFDGDGTNDGGAEEDARKDWTGVTDVENYGTFFGKLFFMIQPAQYIKFRLGSAITHETEHFITKTDECSSNAIQSDGTCNPYNFGHRPVLDEPGNRFRIEESLMWTFFVDATAQF